MTAVGCKSAATMVVRTTTLGHKEPALHAITLDRKEVVLQATSTIGARVVGAIVMSAVRIILGLAVKLDTDPTTTGLSAAGLMAAVHPVVTNAIGTAGVMRAVGKRVFPGIPLAEMLGAAVPDQGPMIDT